MTANPVEMLHPSILRPLPHPSRGWGRGLQNLTAKLGGGGGGLIKEGDLIESGVVNRAFTVFRRELGSKAFSSCAS